MKSTKPFQIWGYFEQPYSPKPYWYKWGEADTMKEAMEILRKMNAMKFGNAPLKAEIRATE